MDRRLFHQLIKDAEERLRQAGIESPAAEVELVLLHLLDVERINLYLYGDRLINDNILAKFQKIIEKRATRYPLQFILKEAWFYGRKFFVSPDVMIPTPETELLCVTALNFLKYGNLDTAKVLDLGVGSGVISVTVAAEYDKVEITAVDISENALKIAQKNAATFGVSKKVSFICSDLFDALDTKQKFHLILSNPPYISDGEYSGLPPEVLADPKISLVSGSEGMDIINRIIKQAPNYLVEGGAVMFEIGYDQAEKVAKAVEQDERYKSYSILKDLNNIDRIAFLKF